MKLIIFNILLIFYLLPVFSYSQCYTILSVKGEIILEKTGQPVKEMDEICKTDKIIFSTPDSKAAVLSPEMGRFVIKLEKKQKNSIASFVSSVLFPGKEKLSTKIILFDDEATENIEFYKKEFGSNYFIINESKVYADPKFFPMNEHNYFYLSYSYNGQDVESRLKSEKDLFFINQNVFKKDDYIINPENIDMVNLYYFDKEKSKRILLTSFKLSFAEEDKVKKEISNYLSILQKENKPYYIILDEIMNFLNDIYGNVNGNDLQSYLKDNFGLK